MVELLLLPFSFGKTKAPLLRSDKVPRLICSASCKKTSLQL